ncbi:MAG: anhydro-N-acetylmuramic acid kinase [Clostridia bacterium]|nr:anhydro-N-acetylmuramic acid kinase [Clostridia bacterium]
MGKGLADIRNKRVLKVIGLMSGTSADGLDAVLTEIEEGKEGLSVRQLGFVSLPYSQEERAEILKLAEGREGGSKELCLFNFWLGRRSLAACQAVCQAAGIAPEKVDLVGSHGQTLYHIPAPEEYLGEQVAATLQLGEPAVIAEGLGCPVVSDFRVRDMAAGGYGAPLVPYAEYLLYRREDRNVGLQNIGGIGNITVLPKGCGPEAVFAFDTGPGNMVMDQLIERMTAGKQRYDEDGRIAASGRCSEALLRRLLDDPYLRMSPPKTTGREYYGQAYVDALTEKGRALGLSAADMVATATRFTAECIGLSIEKHCKIKPDVLVVGGGGSRNPTLLRDLRDCLSIPVLINEDIGFDSDAKEAVAFAVMARACVLEQCNNIPSVTGAKHPVVMGKISI